MFSWLPDYTSLAIIGSLLLLVIFPDIRTFVLRQLGWTNLSLSGIIGDLETKIEHLETHAQDLVVQARDHRDAAAESTLKATAAEADAARAKTIASNVKTL